jgi:polyhydroxybutyrate depolymerase
MRTLISILFFSSFLHATEPKRQEWTVDGTKREALVVLPKSPKNAPVVFVWHGHGGGMQNASRGMAIHPHWPESICLYPQGLPTPGLLTDPEGKKTGWQSNPGQQSNRDLKFFDTMLAWVVKEHGADEKAVFSTGHSNGGGFTYLLWGSRGDKLAGIAPSAAGGARLIKEAKPLAVLHFGSENDPLVKWKTIQEPAINAAKKVNGVDASGNSWNGESKATIYESKSGPPLVIYIHDGEHKFPGAVASKLTVKFFQDALKARAKSGFADRQAK